MSFRSTTSPSVSAASAAAVLDPSDVPTVAARELALALKMLPAGKGLIIPREGISERDLRHVEQAFWQFSKRDRTRKSAVLLRFRSLIEACQSRRLLALLAGHGPEALVHALSAAATMRLNAKWGFNPHKLARAVSEALAGASVAGVGASVALAA